MASSINLCAQTTTIGKLSHKFASEGAKVYVVPGDTFRAAAAEQLHEWARRTNAIMGPFVEGAKPQDVIGKVRGLLEKRAAAAGGERGTATQLTPQSCPCPSEFMHAHNDPCSAARRPRRGATWTW